MVNIEWLYLRKHDTEGVNSVSHTEMCVQVWKNSKNLKHLVLVSSRDWLWTSSIKFLLAANKLNLVLFVAPVYVLTAICSLPPFLSISICVIGSLSVSH